MLHIVPCAILEALLLVLPVLADADSRKHAPAWYINRALSAYAKQPDEVDAAMMTAFPGAAAPPPHAAQGKIDAPAQTTIAKPATAGRKLPPGISVNEAISAARAKIKQGADPKAVAARLQSYGINPNLLYEVVGSGG